MELKEKRLSRHDMVNGDVSGGVQKTFNRYVSSVDRENGNEQVLNQISELQSLLREITAKEKQKMNTIEMQIVQENMEVTALQKRVKSVKKTKEEPNMSEKVAFKAKYIMFCTSERKDMCQLLGSAERTCNIIKECYDYCDKKHKLNRESMVKEHLLPAKPTFRESEDISQLQKQFAIETSKHMLKALKDEKPTHESLWISYEELVKRFTTDVDSFFEKLIEICWTMISCCTKMKFSFDDKNLKRDRSPRIDLSIKPSPNLGQKSSSKSSKKRKNKNDNEHEQLELKYPAVIQGPEVIIQGLKQRKVF